MNSESHITSDGSEQKPTAFKISLHVFPRRLPDVPEEEHLRIKEMFLSITTGAEELQVDRHPMIKAVPSPLWKPNDNEYILISPNIMKMKFIIHVVNDDGMESILGYQDFERTMLEEFISDHGYAKFPFEFIIETPFPLMGELSGLMQMVPEDREAGAAKAAADLSVEESMYKLTNEPLSLYNEILKLPDNHPKKAGAMEYLGKAFLYEFRNSQMESDIVNSIAANQLALRLTAPDAMEYTTILYNLARSYNAFHVFSGEMGAIDNAIDILDSLLDQPTDMDEEFADRSYLLSDSLYYRFIKTGNISDIDRAIIAQQSAIKWTPDDSKKKSPYLLVLAMTFASRFKKTKDTKDIDASISALDVVISQTPAGEFLRNRWSDRATAFQNRFTVSKDGTDIAEAVKSHRNVILLTSQEDPSMATNLRLLGGALWDEVVFHRKKKMNTQSQKLPSLAMNDLQERMESLTHSTQEEAAQMDEVVSIYRKCTECAQPNQEFTSDLYDAFGRVLQDRFRLSKDVKDIDEAVVYHSTSVALTERIRTETNTVDPILVDRFNTLGIAHSSRYLRTGQGSYIDDAISALEKGLEISPPDHELIPQIWDSIGTSFLQRYLLKGSISDLDRSINASENAVKFTPKDAPGALMGARLSHLGNALLRRFERTGDEKDVNEAISKQQLAVQLTPDEDFESSINYNNLGNAFKRRYMSKGNYQDVEEAILAHEKSISLLTEGVSAYFPIAMDNLASSLVIRFENKGNPADLDKAIEVQEKAQAIAPPGHPSIPKMLVNLGKSYLRRFYNTGNLEDIDKGIDYERRALDNQAVGSIGSLVAMHNLSSALMERFSKTKDMASVDEAIEMFQKYIDLTREGHSDTSEVRVSLGFAFTQRFRLSNNLDDRAEAMNQFRIAAYDKIGSPLVRLNAARRWGSLSRQIASSEETLEAYRYALELLQRVAWIGETVNYRHSQIRTYSGLPNEAAAFALSQGRRDLALEWLEYGRCIVWNQLTNLRTPFDALRGTHPELAKNLANVSISLERAGSRIDNVNPDVLDHFSKTLAVEDEYRARHKLAEEWEALIEQVRTIPEYKDFLLPVRLSQILSELPDAGPVVMINVHADRCDALILKSGDEDCIHIPLNQFSYEQAEELRNLLSISLTSNNIRMREGPEGRFGRLSIMNHHTRAQELIAKILKHVWQGVVKPIVDALGYSPSSSPSRMWWCPTGPLAFLPIHAAGLYGKDKKIGNNISDFIISSYTPTIGALTSRNNYKSKLAEFRGMLVVSQHDAPNLSILPGAKKEAANIQEQFTKFGLEIEQLESADATKNTVLHAMEHRSWAHFACHASQNYGDPMSSAFYLHDGALEMSTIVQKSLPYADFAFLSACQTGTGDESLPDEAVHLAAAILSAGYRSIVSTTWSINDEYAPVVAQDVYSYMLENKKDTMLDSSLAAEALHFAITKLRNKIGDDEKALLTWVPFIHIGL